MPDRLPMPGAEQRSQTKFIVFENFEKLNTQSVRQSLSEKELAWLENLQPISPNNLTTVPAPSTTALATIGEITDTMFYAALNGVDYFVVFTTAGSGYLISIATGAVNHFAPDGTFSMSPDVTTWEASRLLIADSIAGYSTFDGVLYIGQGGVSPNITVTAGGSGYGAAPAVTISGGSGSGATAVATVANGAVVGVTLTNPGRGYVSTDTLTVGFGTSPGSGATGTVSMTGSQLAITLASGGGYSHVGYYTLTITGGGGTGAAGIILVSGSTAKFFQTAVGSGYTSTPTITANPTSGVVEVQPTFNIVLSTQSVASITLTAPGSGYAGPPAVAITPPDGIGSGASAVSTEIGGAVQTLSLVPSVLSQLILLTPGNYSVSAGVYSLIFTGGGGSGATGTATLGLDPSGYTANIVVLSAIITANGTNYTSSPTVTVNASGSQATFLCTFASQGQGYDTTPNVVIGSGSGATAIAHVWPFIVSSIAAYAYTTIAVFQGRVWLGGGPLLTWSGTGATYGNVAYDDFLAADASGSLIISDADLIHAITALRALNNYLFIMGDQSVKQIGNVSLNTAGNVTLFTILTLSSDQGTIYKKSCISYNRVFLFANQNGIYGVFGSSVQKLSADLDGIWKLLDFSQGPQGALADINAIHNAVFLIRYVDPLQGERSIMVAFDGKKWFVLSQGNSLKAIATSASLATGDLSLYGSSGPDVTELLAADLPVTFKIQTALTHHGNAVQSKRAMRVGFTSQIGADSSVTMTVDTETGLGPNRTMDITTGVSLVGGSNDANDEPIANSGIYLGLTITGTLAGFTMTNMIIEEQESSVWKGA
jgi:hypothetical protein